LEDITVELQKQDVESCRDEVLMQAMNKYPPVNILDAMPSSPESNQTQSSLDDLPSVPTHAPGQTPIRYPPPVKSPPPPTFMKMPQPEPLNAAPPLPPVQKAVGNFVQLPPPSDFDFPPTLIVEPIQLASWITTRNKAGQQPSVLILDVRPRDVYDQGFIKHKWVAQIEPLVLKQEYVKKSCVFLFWVLIYFFL
jgi:ubiquitin carboxyl-terminal hydrolase 8